MRILHLILENWRNFRRVDVALQQRVFVVGPNASGKSNLMDALRFLQDIASVGGGLQKAVADRDGISKIRCLAARRHSDVVLRLAIGLDPTAPEWCYEIRFSQDNQRRPVIREEIVAHKGTTILRRPDRDDESDKERLTQTHLEQVAANEKFRDVAEFLSSIRYLHIVPQLVRDPKIAAERRLVANYGGDFLERLARASKKTANSRLKRIEKALQVAVPNLKALTVERDEIGTPHLLGRYQHWRPQGAWQDEAQFSDGTLRLIGLLWAVMEGSGPLLLEEPELSLHQGVIRYIPQMLARATRGTKRQVILSTHSAELLSDSGIAPDEVLLLSPGADGTAVTRALDDKEVVALLDAGGTIADSVLPRTAPGRAEQLVLFAD